MVWLKDHPGASWFDSEPIQSHDAAEILREPWAGALAPPKPAQVAQAPRSDFEGLDPLGKSGSRVLWITFDFSTRNRA